MRYAVGVLGTLVVVLAGFVVALWMRIDALDVRIVGVTAANWTMQEVWLSTVMDDIIKLDQRVKAIEQR